VISCSFYSFHRQDFGIVSYRRTCATIRPDLCPRFERKKNCSIQDRDCSLHHRFARRSNGYVGIYRYVGRQLIDRLYMLFWFAIDLIRMFDLTLDVFKIFCYFFV
jgi:hypothetical protein